MVLWIPYIMLFPVHIAAQVTTFPMLAKSMIDNPWGYL